MPWRQIKEREGRESPVGLELGRHLSLKEQSKQAMPTSRKRELQTERNIRTKALGDRLLGLLEEQETGKMG